MYSIIAFFHKAKWTELAITHEINRLLGENTVSHSAVARYVRMFVLSTKETDTSIVPESEGDFSLDDRIPLCSQKSNFFHCTKLLTR
jgi:hypothetical protein